MKKRQDSYPRSSASSAVLNFFVSEEQMARERMIISGGSRDAPEDIVPKEPFDATRSVRMVGRFCARSRL
jgi:hypothetical protein